MLQALTWAAAGTGFTALMTAAGAAVVFLFHRKNSQTLHRVMLGFAAGVMIAASMWSLLIPAIEKAEELGHDPVKGLGVFSAEQKDHGGPGGGHQGGEARAGSGPGKCL